MRVLIADDDASIRAALTDVLTADPRFTVVGTTGDGADLPDLIGSGQPDVVLLDVRMPSGGPAAVGLVRGARSEGTHRPHPAVVALSADTGTATVAAMLRAGVVGYLAKGSIGSSLPDLLARCADGEVVLALPNGADALHDVLRGHLPRGLPGGRQGGAR